MSELSFIVSSTGVASLLSFCVGNETDGCDRVIVTTSGIKDIESSLYCFEANPGISCNKKENLDEITIPITGTN